MKQIRIFPPKGASEERAPEVVGQPRAEALQDEGEQRATGCRGADEGGARGGGRLATEAVCVQISRHFT